MHYEATILTVIKVPEKITLISRYRWRILLQS